MTLHPLPAPEVLSERLLDALRNEDDQWLWEPVWALNHDFPTAPTVEKVNLVRNVVIRLANEGMVELWRASWSDGPIAQLSEDEAARIQMEDSPWYDPEGSDLLVLIRDQS